MLAMPMALLMQQAAVPVQITVPTWLRRPSGRDIARVFPMAAQKEDLDGRATAECKIDPAGQLVECVAKSEDPVDQGFAAAALQLMPLFKMKAVDGTGRPTAGGTVRIPVFFRLPVAATSDPIRALAPAFAGAKVSVDCRFAGTRVDNCFVLSREPRDTKAGDLALELVTRINPPRMPWPTARAVVPFIFVAETTVAK